MSFKKAPNFVPHAFFVNPGKGAHCFLKYCIDNKFINFSPPLKAFYRL